MSGASSVHDPVRDGINAAREAREISSEIEKSVRERLDAMAQAKFGSEHVHQRVRVFDERGLEMLMFYKKGAIMCQCQ